ncbi:SDR family NAD(P)-dependent oxidoreductase [Rhodococcoides yunnanense]|uniref:SDR family NAD(P)-dependent oxidoreductase n=1 Tax=Rhodococcoides yunnanense TaxID=278209 RepID=UPI000932E552|nr:SDR family oxidoreductase [Rhodococcus yunnanensis]
MENSVRTAAITGAGSGIGKQIAVQLATRGWNLHLADFDCDSLLETRQCCAKQGFDLTTTVLNVSDRDQMYAWASSTLPKADSIFNVAGVLHGGDVVDTPIKDFERVMDINFWGVIHGTKAFLPQILDSPRGQIVNVSSAFGVMSAPGYSAYNSSKFAVRGFTEALSQELLTTSKTARATCVIPGGVATSIARTARVAPGVDKQQLADLFDRYIARTDPRDAARKIIAGAEKGKPRVLIGPDARLVDLTVRAFGSNYQRIFPLLQRLRR